MKSGIIATAIAAALMVCAPAAGFAATQAATKPAPAAVIKKQVDCKATPNAKACSKEAAKKQQPAVKTVLKKK